LRSRFEAQVHCVGLVCIVGGVHPAGFEASSIPGCKFSGDLRGQVIAEKGRTLLAKSGGGYDTLYTHTVNN
jgi:hypothetical protein